MYNLFNNLFPEINAALEVTLCLDVAHCSHILAIISLMAAFNKFLACGGHWVVSLSMMPPMLQFRWFKLGELNDHILSVIWLSKFSALDSLGRSRILLEHVQFLLGYPTDSGFDHRHYLTGSIDIDVMWIK